MLCYAMLSMLPSPDVNVWRDKYKALSRELENTRRRLTDQAEEEIQDLMNQKRCMEKQVGLLID